VEEEKTWANWNGGSWKWCFKVWVAQFKEVKVCVWEKRERKEDRMEEWVMAFGCAFNKRREEWLSMKVETEENEVAIEKKRNSASGVT